MLTRHLVCSLQRSLVAGLALSLGVSVQTLAADLMDNLDLAASTELMEHGDSATRAVINQRGYEHRARVDQSGEGLIGIMEQRGRAHRALIDQQGIEMIAVISQEGFSNFASISQDGAYNQAYITQYGAHNNALIEQSGEGLRGSITQHGSGQTIQVIQYQ